MKNRKFIKSIAALLVNGISGFTAFLLVILLGELLSGSLSFSGIHLEILHLQIALVGGILHGAVKLLNN